MSIDFSEHLACLDIQDPNHREVLESSCHEAARLMSPRGLDNYLQGVKAICALGKGQDLPLTYMQEMPGVAKEVGEDVIPDVVHALMRLSSHTSGTVITLLMASLPLAAQRLGDADLLRGFLELVHHLAGKTPRGLRPMAENLDELLSKLTLGGLRRWALWGAQAHARDVAGQTAYFGLATESSRAVLQSERRGTLFVDTQRRLNFYLRALWARAFFMRPTAGDFETRIGLQPYIADHQIHLPDAFDDFDDVPGIEIYRAAAAHAAAHVVHTKNPVAVEQIAPAQMKFIDLFEDARVEWLAIRDFPGLKTLWLRFFRPQSAHLPDLHPAVDLMMRVAHGLLDPDYCDPLPWVGDTVQRFRAALQADPNDNRISLQAGMDFYQAVLDSVGMPGLRTLESGSVLYRDDNRYFWSFSEADRVDHAGWLPAPHQIRRTVSVMEMVNELDCELAGDDAQEVWTLSTPFWLDQEACTINELEGKEPVSDPYHYDEWDHQVQLFRPDWATVIERRQPKDDPKMVDRILERHRPVASRIRHLVDALQPQGIVRRRGHEEGEEIDLNAAVRAMIDIRRGIMPDPRINIRVTRHLRDLAVVVLMDLSESTNDPVDADDTSGPTVLDLTREATALLAWAIDSIGDPFAVHGFASDGRHDVQYYRFKDFQQGYDDDAKARLAGMRGGLSTRMGAALRHAGWHLSQQPNEKRLILLITDGEPADIDERDPQYLRQDTKKAVEGLAARGIQTYCLTLDPNADRYVERIFGDSRYSIIDHVKRLPERLPAVFASITG